MILLDTDHLSILIDRRGASHDKLVTRLERHAEEQFAASIISAEEQCRAWLALVNRSSNVKKQVTAYHGLFRLFEFYFNWEIVPFDEFAAAQFDQLRKAKIRIGTQDLKIASIAITNECILLSSNFRDFEQVPGLRVENWLT